MLSFTTTASSIPSINFTKAIKLTQHFNICIDHIHRQCAIEGIECSGRVQVTRTSLNLSMRVSSLERGMFSISMIPSRWWLPWKYWDNLHKVSIATHDSSYHERGGNNIYHSSAQQVHTLMTYYSQAA